MRIPSLFQFHRSTHFYLMRFMAGLLLSQSLAPFLAYGIMTPADDESALTWCHTRGVSPVPADTQTKASQHFKCPACLFYGQLACGAGVTGIVVLSQQFSPVRPPVNGTVPLLALTAANIRHIRAPPAAI